MSSELSLKVVVIGDSSVGKTCLSLRYLTGEFSSQTRPTIAAGFCNAKVKLGKVDIDLLIWDTAGQEIFRSITRSYYRDSNCAIIVYDITDRSSFEKLGDWIRDVRNLAPPDCQLVLVGNKLDLQAQRVIKTEEAQDFADQNNLMFFEASAATGENVQKLFNECVQAVYSKEKHNNMSTSAKSASVVMSNDRQQQDKGCNC